MSINVIIGAVVAVIILGGGGWYATKHAAHPSAPATEATGSASSTETTGAEVSGTASISSLIGKGDLLCTVIVDNAQSSTSGTLQISGGKVHGEFNTAAGTMSIRSYMVDDGTSLYSWSDAAPQGVKVAISADASASAPSSGANLDTKVDYDCAPWNPDPSVFVPPSDITFMTFAGVK